jgi:hypothetical protein
MGNQFGRVVHGKTGIAIQCLVNPVVDSQYFKVGGVTLDWSTFTAVSGSDLTLPDENVVKVGRKYCRYGQLVTRIGLAEVQTLTLTGGPTAGSAIIQVPDGGEGKPAQTFTVAFNASAAAVQASMRALTRIGANGVGVTRSGAGSAGDPYVFTITYSRELGNIGQLALVSHTFTGGTTPTATPATSTPAGDSAGKFGPYDPDATDGRAILARGHAYLINETLLEEAIFGLTTAPTDYAHAAFEGGRVWRDRLIATTGTHTLAAGPTFTELEALFPALSYLND